MARGHYHSRKRRERATDVASFLLVILLAAGAMLPIWWIFRSSLMTNTELYAYPPAFFPSTLRALVVPELPLPYLRISLCTIFPYR